MLSPRNTLRAHIWVVSAKWTVFAVAGMISTALAFSVLLDSKFTESGISTLNVSVSRDLHMRLLMIKSFLLRPCCLLDHLMNGTIW
jgi:hypothetical protein